MKVIDRILGLKLRNSRVLILLFLFAFTNAAAYLVSRTAADSIFLSRIGPQDLPALHLLSAGCVGVVALLYGKLVQYWKLIPTIRFTLLSLGMLSVALGIAEQENNTNLSLAVTLYVLVQMRGALGTVQFIALLASQSGGQRAELVHGLVAAGATLAGVASGALITGATHHNISIENVMFLAALFDALGILVLQMIPRPESPEDSSANLISLPGDQSPPRQFDPQIVWPLAAMLVLMFAVMTSVEIVWKIVVADMLGRSEQGMARYFGLFYGLIYLLTGAAQLLATARIMAWLGPGRAFLILPAAVTLALGGAAGFARHAVVLAGMTVAKGCDIFRRSLHDPAMQAVYTGLKERPRHTTIVLMGGIVKPCVEAVTAAVLVPLVQFFTPRELTLPVLVLSVLWLAQAAYLSRRAD